MQGISASAAAGGVPDELILECLPLVDSIARRVYRALPANHRVELVDLAQSGVLGLVSAGQGYDPLAAVPFPIYARYRIEGEMLDSLRRSDLAPRRLRHWQKQVSAVRRELTAALRREPTEEELCERLMISVSAMRSKSVMMNRVAAPAERADGESLDPASGPEMDPDHICAQNQLREMLGRLIGCLPARQQQVIRRRYGRHMTLKEIGLKMGVKESRASQMHRIALQALSRMLKHSGISSPADV
jgi:RNA polymerase sigma factor for flagellar operon FliA